MKLLDLKEVKFDIFEIPNLLKIYKNNKFNIRLQKFSYNYKNYPILIGILIQTSLEPILD